MLACSLFENGEQFPNALNYAKWDHARSFPFFLLKPKGSFICFQWKFHLIDIYYCVRWTTMLNTVIKLSNRQALNAIENVNTHSKCIQIAQGCWKLVKSVLFYFIHNYIATSSDRFASIESCSIKALEQRTNERNNKHLYVRQRPMRLHSSLYSIFNARI